MPLGQTVEADLIKALKAKDAARVSCLRLIRNALKNKEKDLRRPLDEPEGIAVLGGLAKQRRDSIAQFEQAGRQDLADQEKAELAVIESYLPRQLDQEEIERVLDQVFAQVAPRGPQDLGRIMKEAMAALSGQADGKMVNQLARARLQS